MFLIMVAHFPQTKLISKQFEFPRRGAPGNKEFKTSELCKCLQFTRQAILGEGWDAQFAFSGSSFGFKYAQN